MVLTRSQVREPLSELPVEYVNKRPRSSSRTHVSKTPVESERIAEGECKENSIPSQNILQSICSPRTPKSAICHTEWISSPFWKEGKIDENPWSRFSEELTLKIFSYLKIEDLCRCSLVCSYWRRLSYDKSLWKKINLRNRNIPIDQLVARLRFGTRYLSLACVQVRDATMTNRFSGENLAITHVDFGLSTISTHLMTRLLEISPNLRKVNLEAMNLSPALLRALSGCRNLEILNLAMCNGVSADPLVAITKNCLNLVELNLAWCKISTKTFSRLFPKRCESMKKLNVSGGRETVTSDVIRTMTTNLPFLDTIDISDCFKLDRDVLTALQENCPCLMELSCSRVYPLSSEDMLMWAGNMPHLLFINAYPSFVTERFTQFEQWLSRLFPQIRLNAAEKSDIARPCTSLRIPKGSSQLWEVYLRP
eukprot:sb/3465002/